MKLKVFYATDGDCLLLTSGDGHHALIDGGRAKSFREQTWAVLQELAETEQVLDLVVVSHIDADHISGILWFMKAVADWTVFEFQVGDGDNPAFPEPKVGRPPTIKKLWHNSWQAQLQDLAGPIEGFAAQVTDAAESLPPDAAGPPHAARMLEAVQALAESIPAGVELRRIVDDATPIMRNKPFRDLVLLDDPPHVERLGRTALTVIGPTTGHLEALRDQWRKWLAATSPAGHRIPAGPSAPRSVGPLGPGRRGATAGAGIGLGEDELAHAVATAQARREELGSAIAAAARTIGEADPRNVTPPNRASITLLAEEDGRTCLLTGDAAEEEILEGLEAAGRIDGGRFPCNVLKVQHHGSEFNLSRAFAETVLADHYVFCGDGAHHNPDPAVVRTIVDARLAVDPRPFTLWFNCSAQRTGPGKRSAMQAAIAEADAAAEANPDITVEVLDDDEPSFEITV